MSAHKQILDELRAEIIGSELRRNRAHHEGNLREYWTCDGRIAGLMTAIELIEAERPVNTPSRKEMSETFEARLSLKGFSRRANETFLDAVKRERDAAPELLWRHSDLHKAPPYARAICTRDILVSDDSPAFLVEQNSQYLPPPDALKDYWNTKHNEWERLANVRR